MINEFYQKDGDSMALNNAQKYNTIALIVVYAIRGAVNKMKFRFNSHPHKQNLNFPLV